MIEPGMMVYHPIMNFGSFTNPPHVHIMASRVETVNPPGCYALDFYSVAERDLYDSHKPFPKHFYWMNEFLGVMVFEDLSDAVKLADKMTDQLEAGICPAILLKSDKFILDKCRGKKLPRHWEENTENE